MTRWRRRIGPERWRCCWPRAWPRHSGAARWRRNTCARRHRHHRPAQGGDAPDREQAAPARHRDPGPPGPAARGVASPVLLAGGREGPARGGQRLSALRQAERQVRRLYWGRLFREIGRKIAAMGRPWPPSPAARPYPRLLGSSARTAAATSSTRCTRRRWSASARAREGPRRYRHHEGGGPGQSSSTPALCREPYDGHTSPPGSPRPSASPPSRSSAPMSTGAGAATAPPWPASSSPSRSAASLRPSAASGVAAAPSSRDRSHQVRRPPRPQLPARHRGRRRSSKSAR